MPDNVTELRKEKLSEPLLRIIGINIKNRRAELGYTQENVAAKMGKSFSRVTVSKHERGGDHMNVGTLVTYSRILQISVHDLIANPVLKDKVAVTPEYYELSVEDRTKVDEYIIQLWTAASAKSTHRA